MTYPHPYLHPPVQLMEHVISHVTSVNQSNNSENYAYVSLLRKYQELLDDYTQGEVLLGLGLGESKITSSLLMNIDSVRSKQDSLFQNHNNTLSASIATKQLSAAHDCVSILWLYLLYYSVFWQVLTWSSLPMILAISKTLFSHLPGEKSSITLQFSLVWWINSQDVL